MKTRPFMPVDEIEEVYDLLVREGANPHKREAFILNIVENKGTTKIKLRDLPVIVRLAPDWKVILDLNPLNHKREDMMKYYKYITSVNENLKMAYAKFY